MLRELVDAYPRAVRRDALATAVEMSASSGTFGQYLGELVRNGLVEKRGQQLVVASPNPDLLT
jgi:hypothetical protein